LIIYLEDKLKPAITKRELKKKCPGEKSGHIFNEIIQNNCPPPRKMHDINWPFYPPSQTTFSIEKVLNLPNIPTSSFTYRKYRYGKLIIM